MKEDNRMYQAMTYSERETLKSFSVKCSLDGDMHSLEKVIIMIAHWMRQGNPVSFTEYAGQWTEAQRDRKDGNNSTPAMAKTWPFSGKQCISRGCSDYYPQGIDNETAR